MNIVKCGLLVNSIDYYIPFIKYFNNLQLERKIIINSIVCNNNEFIYLNFPKLKAKVISETDFSKLIEESDIVFSLGYWKKVKKEDINKVKYGIVNIHNSYRLKYRGRHMSYWVLINNEKIHGTTIHFMNEKIDDGSIIDTDFFEIKETDTSYSITTKANNLALNLLKKNIDNILYGKVNRKENKSKDYYYYKEADLCHEIPGDFLNYPDRLIRNIRALTYPNKPKPYIIINNIKVFLELDNNYDSII